MSRSTRIPLMLILAALAALCLLVGCSDDPVTADSTASDDGLVRADVDPTAGSFELTVAHAGDPNAPVTGPFVIRGRNIHYDDDLGALVADLSVVNHSRTAFPEPVGLTFISLMPAGVEVLNPDNDIHGAGAAIVFEFANDDAMWTPGEESFPRPVHFKTERGSAVAFVARIGIGEHPDGAIGGVVWNDTDGDGMFDIDESGIGGVEVTMTRGEYEAATVPEILYRTHTDRNGLYRFVHLPAGFYTVTRTPSADCRATTPTTIQVILVESDGGVSKFLSANFGCRLPEPPPPPDSLFVDVGDWIEATGRWDDRPMAPFAPALFSHTFRFESCRCVTEPCPLSPCENLPVLFNGPVTDIHRERRALQVMGTWMVLPERTEFKEMIQLEDIEIGDRVSAGIYVDSGDPSVPVVVSLEWWEKDYDLISGYVNHVIARPDAYGPPVAVFVFNTRVDLPVLTADGGAASDM